MADLRQAYRALDPAQGASDPVYVPRPGDPIGLLMEEVQVRTSPLRVLLGGQRGVGKTTELLRLSGLLQAGRAGMTRWNAGELLVESILKDMDILLNRVSSELPLLVLLDGLERVPAHQAAPFIDALRDAWAHLITVAPLPLLLAPSFSSSVSDWDRVIFLPAVSVYTPEGKPDGVGVTYMAEVIGRRTGDGIFEDDQTLEFLILSSAGLHRELLSLAQQACMRAAVSGQTQVTHKAVQATVDDKRHEYSFHLTPPDIEYLREVAESKRITADPRALPLINRNLIVSYQGESAWFDVHPIVKPLLRSGRASGPG
jgi:hypothetical protein